MKELFGSPLRRVLRLGGLAGRVAGSVVGNQLGGLVRTAASRESRRSDNLALNATRIAETLGELKGAAMKVGQMLSLQESVLPPEVAAVLRTLQKQAPPMSFEVVGKLLADQLPDREKLFADFEPHAFAAASIGQVHRATLRDGRPVAVKVQYPGIDRVIEADLGNLRRVLKTLVSLVVNVDFDPVWRELRARLLEELDYRREAETIRRMKQLHADVPDIVIPGVIDEATTNTVLTMEYVPGISPDEACSDRVSQGARDQWGRVLFDFLLRGLLSHRFLHADPNLSNFAFLADGRVVVYDFGCVKEIPVRVARGYRDVCRAILANRVEDVPAAFVTMGIQTPDGRPLPPEMVAPGAQVFVELLRAEGGYRFGNEGSVYERFFELGSANVRSRRRFKLPRDIVFVNRTLAGHFGNLSRLKARAPWRRCVEAFAG
jgi:predicted unusual protein kinase regulating ubiquinone biosynthesis (AarF/ABC1/UbiB family)